MTFEKLARFIEHRMRMSHVYQPVMLTALLRHGGQCSEEDIARELLGHDVAQIEYYKMICRNMVGRVLRKHGIVTRARGRTPHYTLNGYEALSTAQVSQLVTLCNTKLAQFLEARGDQPWKHRKQSSGYVSGTVRYEVLKAAKFRCELCGVPADERALEVDHIVPRRHGGSDDLSNLQALCYSCNAMKRDRDKTDFRKVRKAYDDRKAGCPFCELPLTRITLKNELAVGIRDAYEVSVGHTLVIPRRHVASLFELGRAELNACHQLLSHARGQLLQDDRLISGFNVGVNDGHDAGQTIFHVHWHLIPRRPQDVANPRGGVRNVIPGRGDYATSEPDVNA